MSDSDRPEPPTTVDPELRVVLEALADEDSETIRTVADYTTALARWAETRCESKPAAASERTCPRPAGVPKSADASVVEIDGVAYDYYQWRDGDRIRSETVRR
jgi:hypothetical protein